MNIKYAISVDRTKTRTRVRFVLQGDPDDIECELKVDYPTRDGWSYFMCRIPNSQQVGETPN